MPPFTWELLGDDADFPGEQRLIRSQLPAGQWEQSPRYIHCKSEQAALQGLKLCPHCFCVNHHQTWHLPLRGGSSWSRGGWNLSAAWQSEEGHAKEAIPRDRTLRTQMHSHPPKGRAGAWSLDSRLPPYRKLGKQAEYHRNSRGMTNRVGQSCQQGGAILGGSCRSPSLLTRRKSRPQLEECCRYLGSDQSLCYM